MAKDIIRHCLDCGCVFIAKDGRNRICSGCTGYRKRKNNAIPQKKKDKPKKAFPSIARVLEVERIYNTVNGTAKSYGEMVNIIDSTAADRCVCCGEVIPEGRMVCPICENKGEQNDG